ncbi:hypothetical protein B0H10DRAFT_2227633 [Mycena sp. CBHHK59/15]|nr:hypothetical protein B0H10DRAFT_2227633 [Mycena sp. CBHHK59/15]
MFWSSPIYNRRNSGDEVQATNGPDSDRLIANELESVFSGIPPPATPQTDLPLLFLAIILKGATSSFPWLVQSFPELFALTFAPQAAPCLDEFTHYGRDITSPNSSDESSSDSGNHGDNSGDYVGHSRIIPSSAPTTLVLGQHRITGEWLGYLGCHGGYSVQTGRRLSEGYHSTVYTGELTHGGLPVSKIAIKMSDAVDTLLAEFSSYQHVQELMGPSIPRCYGVCVASGTAFLVTEFVHSRDTAHPFTKAEKRGLSVFRPRGGVVGPIEGERGRLRAIVDVMGASGPVPRRVEHPIVPRIEAQ